MGSTSTLAFFSYSLPNDDLRGSQPQLQGMTHEYFPILLQLIEDYILTKRNVKYASHKILI